MQENAPTSMHSVGLAPMKLILIGTRTAYQATGDASNMDQRPYANSGSLSSFSVALRSVRGDLTAGNAECAR